MEFTVSDAGAVKIVRIEGNLDTQTSPNAEARLSRLIDQGASKVVVNFERLSYISSAGLRILLAAAKRMQSGGGELRVCGLSELVQEVFDISGFDSILPVSKSEAEALDGF